MLRIKNNIKLSKLKEYGFEKTMRNTYFKAEQNDRYDKFETGLLVNATNKKFNNEICYYVNNTDDNFDCAEEDLDMTSTIDTLYDLIKDGLVEKVNESQKEKESI